MKIAISCRCLGISLVVVISEIDVLFSFLGNPFKLSTAIII